MDDEQAQKYAFQAVRQLVAARCVPDEKREMATQIIKESLVAESQRYMSNLFIKKAGE